MNVFVKVCNYERLTKNSITNEAKDEPYWYFGLRKYIFCKDKRMIQWLVAVEYN